MGLNANIAGHKRKRRGRPIFVHVHGHNCIQAAHRRRLGEGSEQICAVRQICCQEQVAQSQFEHSHRIEQQFQERQ